LASSYTRFLTTQCSPLSVAALVHATTLHYCELIIYYRAIYHRATMILYLVSRRTMAIAFRPDSSF